MNFYKSFGFVRKYSELWVHARYLTWLCFQFLRMNKGRTCERRSRNHENIHLPSWKTEPPSFLKHHTFFWTANCQKLQLWFYLLPLFYQEVLLRPQSLLQEGLSFAGKKKTTGKKNPNATIPSTIDGDAACVALCDYPLMPIIMQGNYSIHYEPISTQLAGPCPDFFSPHRNKAEWIPRTQSASQA